jgi:hypothetical protein
MKDSSQQIRFRPYVGLAQLKDEKGIEVRIRDMK